MVKVRGPAFSVEARGTLGDVLTYQGGFGKHRVTRKPGHRDANTEAQGLQREKFLEAVAYWNGLSAEERAQYNAVADPMHMTGYQYVLKLCLLGRIVAAPPEGGFAGGLLELTGVWLAA